MYGNCIISFNLLYYFDLLPITQTIYLLLIRITLKFSFKNFFHLIFMNNLKIAITGRMGSGKSSLSKIIQSLEDAYITSFSSMIRHILLELELEPTRTLLQETGDFFRKFDNLVWTKALLKEISAIDKPIVIDGIRYDFERDKLVSAGFKIIKISSLDELRRNRIAKRDNITITNELWADWQKHPTELYVDSIQVDYNIINNDSLDNLKQSISPLLNELKIGM